MSCSKIFSGDLPELAYEVIKYFQNDFSTLHSCILVNRLWCRLAIPLLWENPFSISTGNYNFIGIYLHDLNDDLKGYEIVKLIPSKLLFNYPNFIKYFNTEEFLSSVFKWIEISKTSNSSKYDIDFIKLLQYKLLLKLFIENEVNLHTLEIDVFNTCSIEYLNDILELILQNIKFIHNIRNLKFYIFDNISESNRIVLFNNHISQIINLQQNLRKILLSHNNIPLYQFLLLSKDYNCSNTLNTLVLFKVKLNGIFNLDKIFERLNGLESVHIVYCNPINTNIIQQIINLARPLKLKSLFIDRDSQIDESFPLLLQKSGDYLENFNYIIGNKYELILKQQIFESIIKYCKNIKLLDLCENNIQISYQILNLIENIRHKLNYLTIITSYLNNGCNSGILLQNLGQALPSKLEYLHLKLYKIKESDFEVFLKNSQDTFIKKLLIHGNESQDILPLIKEYIMKKKKVKYLAIMNTTHEIISAFASSYNDKDLFSLHNEVKEFSLYNIKVQNYHSLMIKLNDFVKEIN